MHVNIISRLGIWGSTFLITLLSVFVSLGITTIILVVSNSEIRLVGILIPVVVPLVIAPPVVVFYGKLLFKILYLEEKMRNLATYDTLTELLSRHAILENASALLHLEKRNSKPFSLLYLDIDYFKMINDQYGHETGDYILKGTGSIIKDSLRQSDLVGRLGGEEFLAILPETNISGAKSVSLKVKNKIEGHEYLINKRTIKITISIGICDSENLGTYDLDALIKQADKCLYQSKENGRNSITFWEDGKYRSLIED